MEEEITVLIADDHPVVLEGLALILRKIESVRVIGLVKNGNEVLDKVKQLRPDVVLLDAVMPDFDELSCVRHINEIPDGPKVICCSGISTKHEIIALVYAGISGFVSKTSVAAEIATAIKKVSNGGKYFSEDVSDMIINSALDKHKHISSSGGNSAFSEKEIEIIQLICENRTVKEISVNIDMNVRTLEAAKNRIMKKMGVKNVVGIVSYAIKNRIIDINSLPE